MSTPLFLQKKSLSLLFLSLLLFPNAMEAQDFLWIESVVPENVNGLYSPRIAEAYADEEGVVIAGMRPSPGDYRTTTPFLVNRDRHGVELWSSELPRYLDLSLHPKSNFVLRDVDILADQNDGYLAWTYYDYQQENVDRPTAIIRHHVDSEGVVQESDSLHLEYRISAQSFTPLPDGSIHLPARLDFPDEEEFRIVLEYWSAELERDSIVISIMQDKVIDREEMRRVDQVLSENRVAVLLSNPATYKSALVIYDRVLKTTKVVSLEMAAEDLTIDNDGHLLVLGRSSGGTSAGDLTMLAGRVYDDGTVEFFESMRAEPNAPASIVGVSKRGEIYVTWNEGVKGVVNVLNPDGTRRGHLGVYEAASLHAAFHGNFSLGENADLYVVMGYEYGRLRVSEYVSSTSNEPLHPAVRFDLR